MRIKSRATVLVLGILSAAMLVGVLVSSTLMGSGSVVAQEDPPGCSTTGKTFTLLKFRDSAPQDGIGETPIFGAVESGETIYFQLRLSSVAGACAISGGMLEIEPPFADGVPLANGVNVTPAGGVPCLGGTIAPCVNGVTTVLSDQLAYEVDCSGVLPAGPLVWEGEWSGGVNHTSPQTGTSAWDSQVIHCVDARISITPNGTNEVGDPHTFVCTVEVDSGGGFDAAPDGTECMVEITNAGPGAIAGSPCLTIGGSCTVSDNSNTEGVDEVQACAVVEVLDVTITRCTSDIAPNPDSSDCEPTPTDTAPGHNAVKCWVRTAECFVLWDEEALDNDFFSVERAASRLGLDPSVLINDNRPQEGLPSGDPNDWVLRWNIERENSALAPGDPGFAERFIARIQTGEDMDEGWYVLPDEIFYVDGQRNRWTDSFGNVIDDKAWAQALVNGTLQQDELDKVGGVQPLRDRDLATFTGKTCVALVWDSDISMNYFPRYANLQGEKLGLFTFTVLDVVMPQATAPDGTPAIPESTSSTSFFDVIIQVEPRQFDASGFPVNNSQQTDTVQTTSTSCSDGTLMVHAHTDNSNARLYIAIEGPGSPPVPPLVSEESLTQMTNLGGGSFSYTAGPVNCSSLRGKVVTIYSDNGQSPLAPDAYGSGGTYNDRIE